MRLNWAEREFETGVDRGVYFPKTGFAEAWNGLISVAEQETTMSERVVYRDGIKVQNRRQNDSFAATVETYTLPQSFSSRVTFGFSYRTKTENGYKIHLVYNAKSLMPKQMHSQKESSSFSFDIFTRPTALPEFEGESYSPTAHLIVDSSMAYPSALIEFENAIYGSDTSNPKLLSPQEVVDIFDLNPEYKVVDNGDGTFTLEAPDDVIDFVSQTLFEIDWPRTVYLSTDTYRIRSG